MGEGNSMGMILCMWSLRRECPRMSLKYLTSAALDIVLLNDFVECGGRRWFLVCLLALSIHLNRAILLSLALASFHAMER